HQSDARACAAGRRRISFQAERQPRRKEDTVESDSGSWRKPLQYFLPALSRQTRRWERNDSAARIPPSAFLSRSAIAERANVAFLRRNYQRPRPDAQL